MTAASVLDSQVLVLNKGYQPITVASASRALSLLFSGAVKALDENMQAWDFDDWSDLVSAEGTGKGEYVHTPTKMLLIPKVVVLQAYNKIPRTKIRFSRQNVYTRDHFTCQYCGLVGTRSNLNLDHVLPRAQGGRTTWENIVCSCIKCNEHKANRTPEQASMRLKRAPKRPTWADISPRATQKTPREWLPFLDGASNAYWNVELQDS